VEDYFAALRPAVTEETAADELAAGLNRLRAAIDALTPR